MIIWAFKKCDLYSKFSFSMLWNIYTLILTKNIRLKTFNYCKESNQLRFSNIASGRVNNCEEESTFSIYSIYLLYIRKENPCH